MSEPSTSDVRELVASVLDRLPRPYTDDLIDDLLFAIESSPEWRSRYVELEGRHGKRVLNTMLGKWTSRLVERRGERQVDSKKNGLTETYSVLDQPAPRRRTREERDMAARTDVFTFFRAHQNSLPPEIRAHHDELVRRVLGGALAEEAFLAVFSEQGWDAAPLLASIESLGS